MARRSHLFESIAARVAEFQQIQSNIFQLQTSPGDGHLVEVYFITADDFAPTNPARTFDLNATWGLAGAYVLILADPAPTSGQLAIVSKLVKAKLSSVPTNFGHVQHGFAWVQGDFPATGANWPPGWGWVGVCFEIDLSPGSGYVTQDSISFTWAQFKLEIDSGIFVDPYNNETLLIYSTSSLGITIYAGGTALPNIYLPASTDIPGSQPGSNNWVLSIPLQGSTTGSFQSILGMAYQDAIEVFGLGFIYAYGISADYLYFPFFDPPKSSEDALTLRLFLNPLLPQDSRATRVVQLPPPPAGPVISYPTGTVTLPILSSSNMFTTDGKPLTLKRFHQAGQLPAGFAFSLTAPGTLKYSAPTGPNYHLSPVGLFALPTSRTISPVDLMPGLSGLEFLRLQSGDLIEFVNDQPAYAPGFVVAGGSNARAPLNTDPLSSTYTTSRARIPTPPAGATRSYFSQPTTSTYFAQGQLGNPAPYPETVQSKLCDFGPQASTPFPLISFGAVFKSFGGSTLEPAGDHVGSDDVMAFEASVLAGERHSLLATAATGPTFMPAGATAPSNALSTAITPQGLVVSLNTSISQGALGAWNAITLARTPELLPNGDDSSLVFNAPTSDLSNVLTRDQLFLVIADPAANAINWSAAPDLTNSIKMGDFAFFFDLFHVNAAGPTVLVFKFNSQKSLQDLVAQPSLWAEPDKFAPNQAAVSSVLTDLIEQAVTMSVPAGQTNPFADFAALAIDKNWTGLIAFNVQIDGNEMTPDFQMLLGGLQGDLRAHHIGIEANLLDPLTLAINRSSLFGVIYYPPPGVSPSAPALQSLGGSDDLRYVVENLIVVFRNSAITLFEATAELIVNAVFGRAVARADGSGNAITIQGQYQVHGGVGTITFESAHETDFTFASAGSTRVLDKLGISRARLVPVAGAQPGTSSETNRLNINGTPVHCAFLFEGELSFNRAPFPASGPDSLDLFSYGNVNRDGTLVGMAYTGLNVDIEFKLGPDGSPVPSSLTVSVDYPAMQPSPAFEAVRTDSLLHRLPAQFSRFLAAPSTSLSSALGASLPIHAAELAGTANAPGGSALAPFATHSPQFALEFDVSLGSLGSLSDGQAINAKLLIGWGPSPFSAGNDAAGLLMQLPQLSAGVTGINIEGVLQVQLGAGNLARVTLADGSIAYAILFNNAQLSALGLTLPAGILADVLIFAKPGNTAGTAPSTLAWFLAAGSGTP